jgi:hypothetical protein
MEKLKVVQVHDRGGSDTVGLCELHLGGETTNGRGNGPDEH